MNPFRVWSVDDGDEPERPNVTAVDAEMAALSFVEGHHADFDYASQCLVSVRDAEGHRAELLVITEQSTDFRIGPHATPAPPPTSYPSAAQQTASAAERVVEHAAIARARGTPRPPVVTDAVAYSRLAAMALGTSWPAGDADHAVVMSCIRKVLDGFNEAHVLAKAATEFVFLTEHSNGSAHREMDGTWTVKHCDSQEKGADGKKKPMIAPVQTGLTREEAIAAARKIAGVGLDAWKAGGR